MLNPFENKQPLHIAYGPRVYQAADFKTGVGHTGPWFCPISNGIYSLVLCLLTPFLAADRAFDKYNVTPTYEFGFGLSYTTFEYSDLKVTAHTNVSEYTPSTGYTTSAKTYGNYSADPADHQFPEAINATRVSMYCYPWLNSTDLKSASADPDYGVEFDFPAGSANGSAQPVPRAGGAPGGNPRLYDVLYTVEATVTNTGAVAGDEVAQLYVSRGGEYEPVRELRGFERLAGIQPGEARTFSVGVTRRDVSSWDTGAQDWVVRDAAKTVWVGRSSRDLPLSQALA